MAISMLKIRRPLGRLIFNMGIAIPGKTVFLIETAPRAQDILQFYYISIIASQIAGDLAWTSCWTNNYLFNSLLRLALKKTQKLLIIDPCRVESTSWLVDSPHKGASNAENIHTSRHRHESDFNHLHHIIQSQQKLALTTGNHVPTK